MEDATMSHGVEAGNDPPIPASTSSPTDAATATTTVMVDHDHVDGTASASPPAEEQGSAVAVVHAQPPASHPSSSSFSLPSSFYQLPPPFLPPFHSRVLASNTAAQMWILTIHQFYHAPASWGKGMAHMLFAALKEELRQSPSSGSSLPPSLLSLLTGRTWEGQARSITLDEFMARFNRFPKDYAHQLWREFITSKSPLYPGIPDSSAEANTGGYSLLNNSNNNHTNSPSLLEIGRNALLPSLRKMATRSDSSTGGINLLCGLLHRRIGTSSHRIAARASPLISTAAARTADLYARRMRKLKVVTGHVSAIYCVTFDQTGQRFFTGSDDFLVKVWDAATGRLVQTCRGHENNITEISVSPDNLLVVSASEDGKIRVWDINGIPIAVLRGHTKAVMRVIFVPNFTSGSRLLISISLDGTARVWDCSNLSQPPFIINAKSKTLAKTITYFPLDLEGLSWNAAEADGNFSPIHTPEFLCVSVHPLGTEFVVGHNDKNARVYDMKHKCVIAVLSGHTGEVENVSYSHSGNRIVTISESGEAFIWARVEADQVTQAANTVNFKLPTTAPSPPEWNEQLMHATSHYAGLARAVAATPVAAHSYRQPVHPAASMAAGELLNQPLPHDPKDPNAIPTHRYIIVANLRLPGSMKNIVASQPPAGAASSSSKLSILSAIWSQNDDYIFGCTSSHSAVVWHIPSVISSTCGGPLEMVDPFIVRRQEEAAYAASKAKQQQNRATSGRTKRSANKGPDRLQPKPVTFLSCFKRTDLLPTSVFNVHTATIQFISMHPTIADLYVTSGADGRVALFDVRSGRVLRVFHEQSIVPPLEPVSSPMSDGCFSPTCTSGDKFVLANENGQLYIYGMGLASTPYLIAPEQQYFVRDSMALTRDQFDHVIDTDSQRAPHLAPGATTLCDLNGVVYSHPLPPILPLKVVGTPVKRIVPNSPSTRVLTLDSSSRVRRGYWLLNSTGVSPVTDVAADLQTTEVEPDDEPFNGDFWRTQNFSRSLAVQNAADFYANNTSSIPRLIGQTWEQDLARVTYFYQVKQAFQQQISLLKIAFQSASGATAPAIDFQQIASNWYPSLVLPLPATAPLVKYEDVEQLQVTRTGEDEASEGETRYLRQYVFDGYGTAWKLLRHLQSSAARPHLRPSFPSRRPTAASLASPSRVRSVSASRAATGTPSRPLAIDVDGGDDDYFDDDYQPDGGGEPASSLSIRAQARQLQRFETLRNRGRNTASAAPAAASASARPRANRTSHIQYRELDEEEEKKMLESGTDAEQSEYSDAEAAGNAEAEEEEDDDEGEEEEVDEYEEPRRRNTNRRTGGGRRRNQDDYELTDESSAEESEESEESGGSESSDGDSDGSYRRSRQSKSKKKSKKKSKASRKRRRDEDSSEEDDFGEDDEENPREGRARKRAALNASPKVARSARGRSKFYGGDDESSFQEDDEDDSAPVKRSAASADAESGFDERLYNPGNWLQRPLVQIYNSSYVPQLGDRVLYMRQGHESALSKNLALPRTHLPDSSLPPLVHALVARVEYVWLEDADKTTSSNRLYSLPKNHSGQTDVSYCRKNEPPPIFARLTLVPLEDADQISNSRHPSLAKSATRSSAMIKDVSKEYDFSSLPPPTSSYHLTSVDTDNMTIRLRKVGKGGAVALSGNKMILPSRQSLRSALNQSMHDAPAAPVANDSSLDALTSAYMKASAAASSSSSRSPQKKGTTRIILRGARSGAPEAAEAPTSEAQSSARSRQPKRPDPYELHQMKEEELKAEKEQEAHDIMRIEARDDCLQFPSSAFTVDLFEPQGADWLILLSRLQVSQSSHPAQWSCGEKFRMKYSDESDWSVGVICANTLVDEQSERRRPSRNKNAPVLTAWESLRITWRSEEEIQAALNAAAEERSKSLVADPLAALPAEVQAIQRRMQLLEQWGQEASENDIVSPWEIDTMDRVTIKIESLDTWVATAESKELSEKANDNTSAAASSSSSPTVKVPELAHVLEPDALIDTTEYLSSAVIDKLLPIIEKALNEPLYGVFCEPVPRNEYPIYAHAVPYACDLSTIQTRLRLRWYRTVAAVVNDCIAIRRAALLYNAPDSDIAQAAIGLEQTLLRRIWHAFKKSHRQEFEMFIHTDNDFDWNAGDHEDPVEEEEATNTEPHPNAATVKVESNSTDVRMEEERKDNQSSIEPTNVAADQAVPMDMDDDSSQAKFLQAVAAANSQSESKNPA